MCKILLSRHQLDPTFMGRIIWTDECYFKMNGTVNTNNLFWWGPINPHVFVEHSLNGSGVMTFLGITRFGPIGPFFFDELQSNQIITRKSKTISKKTSSSVSGASYKEMFHKLIYPTLEDLFPSDELSEMFYQMDGARGHNSVKEQLEQKFPGRWIANHAISPPISWSPRSPDLSPLDFSFWGVIRDKIYSRAPNTIAQLKQFITEEIHSLPLDYYTKICTSAVLSRLQECKENGGQLIEPFIS